MNWMRDIFAVPFGYVMALLYMMTGNYVFSIIILTVVVRLLILPFSVKQQKNSSKQVRLQPKVRKIQEKFKGDQMKINEETQALYRREGFSMMQGGCLPLAVQFPVMIGLFSIIYTPLTNVLRISKATVDALTAAYQTYATSAGIELSKTQLSRLQITILENFNTFIADKSEAVVSAVKLLSETEIANIQTFIDKYQVFGIRLFEIPNYKEPSILWLIPILAGITSALSAVFMYFKQKQQNPAMGKNPAMGCMMFYGPLMSLVFAFAFPVGAGFYWIVSNIISFIQQVALSYAYAPKKVIAQSMVEETVIRRARENNVKKRVDIQK